METASAFAFLPPSSPPVANPLKLSTNEWCRNTRLYHKYQELKTYRQQRLREYMQVREAHEPGNGVEGLLSTRHQ